MNINKIFLELREKKMMSHIVESVSELSNNIVLSIGSRDKKEDYVPLLPHWVRIEKDKQEQKAALFGMLTGFRAINSEYALVIASDIPFINIDVVKHLYQEAFGFNLALPVWPNGDIEPLYAVYKVSETLKTIECRLKEGKIRIRDSIDRLGKVKYIPVNEFRKWDKDLRCFLNINTQEDLLAVEEILKGEANE
jgi:molybdopterin-guanine dinucleotide biosynthesis protein A